MVFFFWRRVPRIVVEHGRLWDREFALISLAGNPAGILRRGRQALLLQKRVDAGERLVLLAHDHFQVGATLGAPLVDRVKSLQLVLLK